MEAYGTRREVPLTVIYIDHAFCDCRSRPVVAPFPILCTPVLGATPASSIQTTVHL